MRLTPYQTLILLILRTFRSARNSSYICNCFVWLVRLYGMIIHEHKLSLHILGYQGLAQNGYLSN